MPDPTLEALERREPVSGADELARRVQDLEDRVFGLDLRLTSVEARVPKRRLNLVQVPAPPAVEPTVEECWAAYLNDDGDGSRSGVAAVRALCLSRGVAVADAERAVIAAAEAWQQSSSDNDREQARALAGAVLRLHAERAEAEKNREAAGSAGDARSGDARGSNPCAAGDTAKAAGAQASVIAAAPRETSPQAAPAASPSLLPCPFCGGKAVKRRDVAGCEDTGCAGSYVVVPFSWWNRRAASPNKCPGSSQESASRPTTPAREAARAVGREDEGAGSNPAPGSNPSEYQRDAARRIYSSAFKDLGCPVPKLNNEEGVCATIAHYAHRFCGHDPKELDFGREYLRVCKQFEVKPWNLAQAILEDRAANTTLRRRIAELEYEEAALRARIAELEAPRG